MKESELTEFVRKDLKLLGYETYAEVCWKGGGSKRCDMYTRRENIHSPNFGHTIVYEAKMTFNLKVIEQAYFWKDKAHEVYIIVPTIFRNKKSRHFARKVCKQLGIGVIEVSMKNNKYIVSVKSGKTDEPKYPQLFEQQKNSVASVSNGEFITPFKITVENINKYMEPLVQCTLIQMIRDIKHHYKSDLSASRAIRKLIDEKVIKGFYIKKENNKLVIVKNGF